MPDFTSVAHASEFMRAAYARQLRHQATWNLHRRLSQEASIQAGKAEQDAADALEWIRKANFLAAYEARETEKKQQ